MTDQLVKDNERIDDLQNGYYVIQDPDKFCFGMDAVLLSGFAKVKKGETALDLGTGTGIIPILLKTKTNGKHFTGLEIQKECADMAGRSVRYNHLEDDVEIVRGDIKEAADIFGAASFDVVTSNPPYMIGQHGPVSYTHLDVYKRQVQSILLFRIRSRQVHLCLLRQQQAEM